MTPVREKIHVLIAISVAAALAGCGPTKPPVDELGAASRALGSARLADAAQRAPTEFRSASRHFDQAQAAEHARDYEAATWFAGQSQSDSELAVAKSRRAKAREAVDGLTRANADLDSQLTAHAESENPR